MPCFPRQQPWCARWLHPEVAIPLAPNREASQKLQSPCWLFILTNCRKLLSKAV